MLGLFREILTRNQQEGADNRSLSWALAHLAVLEGDNEAALGHLERAVEQGYLEENNFTEHWVAFRPLLGEPRLDALVTRMNEHRNEQRALLAKKSIRAPFAGTLGLRQVDLGEFIPVGTPIVEVNTLDPIQLDFTIGERNLPLIGMGDPVEITVAAFPDQTFRGSVLAIESSVRATTRTVQVRAQLPNPDRILRPGMFANVTLFRNTSRTAITVPRTAISYNTYGDFVFLISESDGQATVERVQVDTGDVREGHVEITDGLTEGQRIVANGLNRLRSGQPVKVEDSTGTESAAAEAR